MKTIEEMFRKLSPDLQQEIVDFVQSLMEKRTRKSKGVLKLDWRGALKDIRDHYTSVELQHRMIDWWSDDE